MCETSPCSNTQPWALSKGSARKLLPKSHPLLPAPASFICSCDAENVGCPCEHSSSLGTAQVHEGRADSLSSFSAFLEPLLHPFWTQRLFPHSCPKSSKFHMVPRRLQIKSIISWGERGDCSSVKVEVKTSPDL